MAPSTGDPPNPSQDTALRLDRLVDQLAHAPTPDPELREALVHVAIGAAVAYEALSWRRIDEGWVRQLLDDLHAWLPESE